MFLLFQATLPPKELEKVYRDIFMIDFKKIMISMAVIDSDFTWFRPLFKMTTANRPKNQIGINIVRYLGLYIGIY